MKTNHQKTSTALRFALCFKKLTATATFLKSIAYLIIITFFTDKAYCADGDKWVVNVFCQHVVFNIKPISASDSISISPQLFDNAYRLIKSSDGRSVYNDTIYFQPRNGHEKILNLGLEIDQDFPMSFDNFGITTGTFHITRGIGSHVGTFRCQKSPVGAFDGTFNIIELTGILVEKGRKIYGTLTSSESVNGETVYMVLGDGKGQSSFWNFPGRTYVSDFPSTPKLNIFIPDAPRTTAYANFYGSATQIPSGASGLGLSVQISEKPNGPWVSILNITNSLPKIYTNQFYRILIK